MSGSAVLAFSASTRASLSRVPIRAALIPLVCALILIPTVAAAALESGEFSLQVEGDRIYLEAQEAPRRTVLTYLGQDLGIPIEALTSAEETVTTAFHDLPLKEAMQRLSRGVVYVHDDRGNGIAKIVVLPSGDEAAIRSGEKNGLRVPEPLQFEFDPLAQESEQ